MFLSVAYRGYKVRQKYGPLLNAKTGKIDLETSRFIRPFAKRWKAKSIFRILLLYRSARYQDLVNLTQQVRLFFQLIKIKLKSWILTSHFFRPLKIHLYNQAVVGKIKPLNELLELEKIDPRETNPKLLGYAQLPVRKLPFRLNEIPFYDTNFMCDPLTDASLNLGDDSDNEEWDAPLRRTVNISTHISNSSSVPSDLNANKYQR